MHVGGSLSSKHSVFKNRNLNVKVSFTSDGGCALFCRLLCYPGTVFRWQVRGSLALFLKLSGFLTIARKKVDKKGARQKEGHLKHWFSESPHGSGAAGKC